MMRRGVSPRPVFGPDFRGSQTTESRVLRTGPSHTHPTAIRTRTFHIIFPGIPLELSPPRGEVSFRGRGVGGNGIGGCRGELDRLDTRLRFAGHHDGPEETADGKR